jgi:ribonuclease HI
MIDPIIQWNCRGLRANYTDLLVLLGSKQPSVCCLQELKIPPQYSFPNRQYTLHISDTINNNFIDTGILINKTIPNSKISLSVNFSAVACRISLHKPITVCSVYLPPSSRWDHSDLLSLLAQLPPPVLLMGDFNAHGTLWGCTNTDNKGVEIEDLLLNGNVCLLNKKMHTYLHPATGSRSALDLSFCDPSLFLDFSWSVHSDLCGSDHYPVILSITSAQPLDTPERYKVHAADWAEFTSLCITDLDGDKVSYSDDPISAFVETMLDIADSSIPKTRAKPKRIHKPWFTDECQRAIINRKKTLAKFKVQATATTLDAVRKSRAQARRTLRQAKKDSWRKYISTLTTRTPVKKVWQMVSRIAGKHQPSTVSHLEVNGTPVEEPQQIANTLAATISHNSSCSHYTHVFQQYKAQAEKHNLQFKSTNKESYNQLFSLAELQCALKKSHDTAPGPDNVHYQMLKHLPESCLLTLLSVFNDIWTSGKFPSSWSEATVIPLPKPGKDHKDPGNYRPIALTSCICKTFERMVNDRLMWYLETKGCLSALQSGFRKQRSTTDQLVRLETFIRDGLLRGEHVVSVFFDLEKAYDTTWKYGIMRDLHATGLKGRLPLFIADFLANRQFRVRLGSTLSDYYSQEMGVPQGSILSVTLFILKINSIVNCLPPHVRGSLYVDDFLICYRSKDMRCLERQLQFCLNKIERWADENGFRFSKSKSVCMHFCHKRIPHPDPELKIYDGLIPVVEEAKFLGLIFDRKLTFKAHIKYLKDRCLKTINLLRVVAHTDWGADSATLLRLYRALVRSKLDYGCIIYGSARKSYLQPLDRVQNLALRICLGAFRTTPIPSLHVEAHEMPIHLRRDKLALQYMVKLKSNMKNPAYDCVFRPDLKALYHTKVRAIPTLGIRMSQHIKDACIPLKNIAPYTISSVPPWTLHSALFVFELHYLGTKDYVPPDVYLTKLNELLSVFTGHHRIFTDGSKDCDTVGAAAVCSGEKRSVRLPDHSSIFSAEAHAILLALDIIQHSSHNKFIILSDSLSCLQSIHSMNLHNPLILDICNKIHKLTTCGNSICFIWIPSHIGISGNTLADSEAKAALQLPVTNLPVPHADFVGLIKSYVDKRWQQSWDTEVHNKLHGIQPLIHTLPMYNLPRRDERLIHRLRVGHTHLTHSFVLKKEQPPHCTHCQVLLTVQHILIDCTHFNSQRVQYFNSTSLHDLFTNVNPQNIIDFIKTIGLYRKV